MSSDNESVKVEEDEVVDDDISNPDILSKYRLAADIANRTLLQRSPMLLRRRACIAV